MEATNQPQGTSTEEILSFLSADPESDQAPEAPVEDAEVAEDDTPESEPDDADAEDEAADAEDGEEADSEDKEDSKPEEESEEKDEDAAKRTKPGKTARYRRRAQRAEERAAAYQEQLVEALDHATHFKTQAELKDERIAELEQMLQEYGELDPRDLELRKFKERERLAELESGKESLKAKLSEQRKIEGQAAKLIEQFEDAADSHGLDAEELARSYAAFGQGGSIESFAKKMAAFRKPVKRRKKTPPKTLTSRSASAPSSKPVEDTSTEAILAFLKERG